MRLLRSLRPDTQRGATLLVSMVLVMVMIGVGLGVVWLSRLNMASSRSLTSRQAAMNAAQAGIQHARATLAALANASATNPWSAPLAGQGDSLDNPPTTAKPNGIGVVLYQGTTRLVDTTFPAGASGAARIGSYTVWIRNDAADINANVKAGAPLSTDSNSALIVRALGRDPNNEAQVILEAAINKAGSLGGGGVNDSSSGKNVDVFGSNTITGSVGF
jgi:Tfp pilus assembly protein PilX